MVVVTAGMIGRYLSKIRLNDVVQIGICCATQHWNISSVIAGMIGRYVSKIRLNNVVQIGINCVKI